jgi:hypothetical protein
MTPLKKDSVYDMENIVFKENLSIDEKASSRAIDLYKNYLLKKQPKLKIEIIGFNSSFIRTEDDRLKAANNLKKLIDDKGQVSIKIEGSYKKGMENIIVFKIIRI